MWITLQTLCKHSLKSVYTVYILIINVLKRFRKHFLKNGKVFCEPFIPKKFYDKVG